jgi:hypothetical protein
MDAINLTDVNALSNPIIDAAWWNGFLVTLRDTDEHLEMQRWLPANYAIVQTISWPTSEFSRILPLEEGVLVIRTEAGIPMFSRIDIE